MNILANGLIWGILLIAFGCSIIIKALFGITIPVIRPLIGLFLIYVGTVIITNLYTAPTHSTHAIMFSKANVKETVHVAEKYTIICGEGTIDLSGIPMPSDTTTVELSTIMGNTTLILNPAIPTRVMINAAFSTAHLPDETVVTFGNYVYQHNPHLSPQLEIRCNIIFGALRVIN